jgi:magnesium transporter
MASPKIQKFKSRWCTWFVLPKHGRASVQFLKKNFNFHPLDIEDCTKNNQQAKISEYPKYIFGVLLFPVFNKETRQIEQTEVDFFLTDEYIVTLHDNELFPFINLIKRCEIKDMCSQYLTSSIELLQEIIERLLRYCYPILDHLNEDINRVENAIFAGDDKGLIKEILFVELNIFEIRKILHAQQAIIKKISERVEIKFNAQNFRPYFQDLIDHAGNIWEIVENQRQTIYALQEAHASYSTHSLNNIVKSLTAVSAIFLPVSFITWIFAMRTPMPWIERSPISFWLVLLAMIIVIIGMFLFFRRKKWL